MVTAQARVFTLLVPSESIAPLRLRAPDDNKTTCALRVTCLSVCLCTNLLLKQQATKLKEKLANLLEAFRRQFLRVRRGRVSTDKQVRPGESHESYSFSIYLLLECYARLCGVERALGATSCR